MRFTVLTLTLASAIAASPGCVNDSGEQVDWYVAMKMPAGGEYYYFGPDSKAFTKSSEDISKGGDAIDQTLDSLYSYKSSSTHAHGMWNDQPTKEKAAGSIYAHSKGVFHFDDEQGFYLIHSVPAYPSNKDHGYDQLESTSTTYGQSFMCLTMKTSEFDKLGKDLQTMHVFPYDSDFSDDLADVVPNMVDAMDKVENKDVQSVETHLTTVGGESFKHFAKGRYWGKALYEDLVAVNLDSDLACDTWQNGAYDNQVPTYCPPDHNHTISNIDSVIFGDGDSWKSTQDHSKWAITTEGFDNDTSKTPSACIGGINRQFSQEKRGGATMCVENKVLNGALYDSIDEYEDCEKR
ncbi:hypothetical protein TrST_g4946 [Triparma strigata]|uniref:Uncharacterized protein n=1 Tax=Triparma strigata TaxID=1606541 RepID=A0A9W7BMH9_9STRA|nr:hypothetical protein TrST_g4946 [Triparma strigata]